MESVFPEDSILVFVLDTSNENQMANLRRLAGMFPELDEDLSMLEPLKFYLEHTGIFEHEDEIKAFFAEPFRFGVAVRGETLGGAMEADRTKNTAYAMTSADRPPLDFFVDDSEGEVMEIYSEDFWMDDADLWISPPDTSGLRDQPFGTVAPGSSFELEEEFYFAVESEAAHVLEKALTELMKENPELFSFEEKRGVKYWHHNEEEGSIVRYGDIFFVSNKNKSVEEAIDRLNKGESFFVDDSGIDNLAYLYVGDLEEFGLVGLGRNVDLLGAAWSYFIVEADGLRIKGKQEFTGNKSELATMGLDVDHDFGLARKIGGDGVFLYNENFNLLFIVDTILDAFPFDVGLEVPAALVGLDIDSFRALLDSPFAFVASHTGGIVPNIAFYLDVGEDKVDDARAVVAVLSEYLEEVLVEFEDVMVLYGQESPEDILQKDLVPMKGTVLHRLVFNLSDYDDDMVSSLGDLELYYGVTHDNVLVTALHGDFVDYYGKNVVSGDAIFERVYSNVSAIGGSMMYFDFDLFSDVLSGFFSLGGADDVYDSMVKPFLAPLKFAVNVSSFEAGFLWSELFVLIEEIEEEIEALVDGGGDLGGVEIDRDEKARILR